MTEEGTLEIVEHRVTTDAAPYQIEGKLSDGRYFYFRARHRNFRLGIGATKEEAIWNDDVIRFEMDHGFAGDNHPLSVIGDTDALHLAQFLVRLYQQCENHKKRVDSGATFMAILIRRSHP